MKQISILGCGWLGLPLAKALLQDGLSVKGSTTSTEKLAVLESAGIIPHQVVLESDNVSGPLAELLTGSSVLVIDIPPKLRGNQSGDFVSKIKTILPFIEKSTVENVLFISSTSVYGDDNDQVTEETTLNPDTEGGRQLQIVEALLQNNSQFKTTILRFGGLIGEDRNPVRFLAGKENLDNPNAPINLIHQADCIGIIKQIIAKNAWDTSFNAATPYHPSRETYYTQKAVELGLTAPTFDHTKPSIWKTIVVDKIENTLEYTFQIIPL
ncbi:SDR family oxidoreductase [Flavobacterium sp.]|uniref:SDR family oxidoreductase n=1 Tax=Flavobacterium sp. TaxID=239 RepID=UPI0026102424|nr:SDR family oxidoreductase [Flavobacterium sp.]MDG2431910.1 SDR family oxidoreductase [Flavobacterium sp.]